MKCYLCYIHTPGSIAPQLRVLNATDVEELAQLIARSLKQWPKFEAIDVYDDLDNPVFRVGADETSILH